MITKIIIARSKGELSQMIDDFGTYYIKSSHEVNKEFQKYNCPFRLSEYIDELKNSNQAQEVDENNEFDFIFDMSEKTEIIASDILKNGYSYDEYIEETPHLDKYGNV